MKKLNAKQKRMVIVQYRTFFSSHNISMDYKGSVTLAKMYNIFQYDERSNIVQVCVEEFRIVRLFVIFFKFKLVIKYGKLKKKTHF